ncbi:uncharacterized protein LOC17893096 [Capsella rubella]|uniref:uncharacterized protein LOC17893096 n=1 Tax=Capsella rubella TaxID=81985 RepID=UPI000CD4EBCA|nr:uncharacterized protein LOC17893096 [Capsella rubella]
MYISCRVFFYQKVVRMDESRKENIQEEVRREKVIAVEIYNGGDLAGAKELTVKAHNLDRIDEGKNIIDDACRILPGEKEKQVNERPEDQPLSRVTDLVNQSRMMNGGERKRKEPPSTNTLHVPHQIRRINEDGHINCDLELTTSLVQSALDDVDTMYAPTSQYNSIGAAAEGNQASKDCDEAERVEIVNEEDPYVVDMSVPDPDFYHFDKDRIESSFGENEVWALYDDYGILPRNYAFVHKVVSQEPFKLCISWLNCKKNDELGPMKWIESYYYKTSGNFSVGKRTVWALYENWSPAWDITISLEVMNKFEMVEVQQDFDDEKGVRVAPLVKLPGFHNIFCRHPTRKTYPREELFRFSHQVPFHLLTGEEGENAPKGCLELDPAALTPELLKAFIEDEMGEVGNALDKPEKQANEILETINNI